jgi:serine protease AprX
MSRWIRLRLAAPLLATAALLAGLAAVPGTGAPTPSAAAGAVPGRPTLSVIVQARVGHRRQAAAAVRSAGGSIGRDLPIVHGFSARLPAAAARRLGADPSIRRLTPDSAVRFSSIASDEPAVASNYPKSTGATTAWGAGNRGAGVTVALIDTGVAPVADLAGRVVAGPDFSGERDSRVDSYGHGTVMAGIIAGDGASSANASGGAYIGMAPGARLLSVKVAGSTGATDVSTVLAALQWVASHAATFNIRAVNLAWGTPSDQSPSVDPLDYAVERVWRAGVVVVAAGGNHGPAAGTVTKPGDDPLVITAGAYDDRQNTVRGDDDVTAWSSRGPTAAGSAKPDLVAPGRTIVATRSPGSYVDMTFPQARVGAAYIRGSGTSQATAVISGAVALMVSQRDSVTPDQVKFALTSSSVPIPAASRTAQGHGRLWLPGATVLRVSSAPVQKSAATGLGSLEQSRGGRHVDATCPGDSATTKITGEQDSSCQAWDAQQWTSDSWSVDSWTSSRWSGDSWSRVSWSSDSWSSDSWTSDFQTAFWGSRTPWRHRLPGELAESLPVQPRPVARPIDREGGGR